MLKKLGLALALACVLVFFTGIARAEGPVWGGANVVQATDAQAPADAGRHVVGRYLTDCPFGKGITRTELAALKAAKNDVFLYYRPGGADVYGGTAAGKARARTVKAALGKLGLSIATPVYYCIDVNAPNATVVAYFRGIVAENGVRTVGASGGYFQLKALRDARLCSFYCQTWLWSFVDYRTGLQVFDPRFGTLTWLPQAQLHLEGFGNLTAWADDFGQISRPKGGLLPSLADILRSAMRTFVGHPYRRGAVAFASNSADCSGLIAGAFRKLSREAQLLGLPPVKWRYGSYWPRLDAHGYYRNTVRATRPYRPGDVVCFVSRRGHCYHIALIIGKGPGDRNLMTIEARGRRWGVVMYSLYDPHNGVLARGGHVRRFSWLNLGQLN